MKRLMKSIKELITEKEYKNQTGKNTKSIPVKCNINKGHCETNGMKYSEFI